MTEKRIATGNSPEIIVETVNGNLDVKGWEEPQVELRASSDTLDIQEGDDLLRASCTGNLELRLPVGADLQVGVVHGQARLRRMQEPLPIGEVYGSLSLREVAEVSLGTVHGELSAREISGGIKAERVRGNVTLRDVQGACLLQQVDGNLEARNVAGDFQVSAEGNLRLRLSEMAGDIYQIRAGGNLYLELPEDAGARLTLSCDGKIKVKFSGQASTMVDESYELVLGDGRAAFTAQAGGHIYLTSLESEWGGTGERDAGLEADYTRLSEDITRQVEVQVAAQMEAMTHQLNEQMVRLSADLGRAGMSDAQVERIVEKARRSSERAQERAQEKMRRAQEKIARDQEKIQRKVEYSQQREAMRGRPPMPPPPPGAPGPRRGWGFDGFGVSQPSPATTGDPVSEEERLMILRMLEQKKISIAEAEQLLAALESREGTP